jgi:uncharacterized membrane protein YfcA
MTSRIADPPRQQVRQRAGLSFLFAIPISILGGLMGLGGAEYRLPVLVGVLKYSARRAVPLNLAVSLVTLVVSLFTRLTALPSDTLTPLWPVIAGMTAGAVTSALFGTALAHRVSDRRLEQLILILLVSIGVALLIEGFLPTAGTGFIPTTIGWRVTAAVGFGLGIGLVSSLLGVAGGELIIPTLLFAFGVDIKTAGTASVLISLPTVAVGLARYARQGAFADRQVFPETIIPMSIGSILGAPIGTLLVGIVSQALLKVLLGIILIVSAMRVFRDTRKGQSDQRPITNNEP